ncbi:MAG: hypothetical protein KY469_04335 [Actinobacteria bacterium]|nr:hypothetical protein [Actinomycetota bacterium]
MERNVETSRPILVDDPWPVVERFLDEPASWLPGPAHELAGGRFRSTIRLGRVTHAVVADVGDARSLAEGWVREVGWTPASGRGTHVRQTRYLPGFDGEVVLRNPDPDTLELEIVGHYQPPFGVVGALVDVIGMHRAAEVTVDELAEDIVARLEALSRARVPASR